MQRFRACNVGRMHHVAASDAELGPIGVSGSGVNVVQSCLAVGNAGGVGGALAVVRIGCYACAHGG